MPRYTIEIAGPRNEGAIFPPIGNERLRGRWSNAKVAHRNKTNDESGLALKQLSLAVETIPGLFISLDTTAGGRGEGSIVDPLGESPAGREIQAKIKDVLSRFSPNALDCGSDPRPRSTFPNLGADGIKEWAFFMRTMLDSGQAAEVGTEKLPDIETIRKMPGKRRRDPLNTGRQDAESEAEARKGHGVYRYADEVPENAELVGAGPSTGNGPKGGSKPPTP
jgi:hypothetical protein